MVEIHHGMVNINEQARGKKLMLKCPHCNSENLEYYPDVDSNSWVNHIYKQTKDGWKIEVFVFEDNGEKRRDVSTIKDGDIYSNDGMPFMYCKDCTAEIDGRRI